jgi:menaquinone-dependent protoporphyrinogen oxidase
MIRRFLVAYATRHGATVEVAEAIAETLHSGGAEAEVLPAADATDLTPYDAVILGSPIYSSEWLPAAREFVAAHRATLSEMPTACFVLAIRLHDDSEVIRETIAGYLTPERVTMQPVSIGYFAGALDLSKLSAITRLQVQTKNLPEGDFRDWEAIRAWAASLPGLLFPTE